MGYLEWYEEKEKKKRGDEYYQDYVNKQNIQSGKDTLLSDFQNLATNFASTGSKAQDYINRDTYTSGVDDDLHNNLLNDSNTYNALKDKLSTYKSDYENVYGKDTVKAIENGLNSIGKGIKNVSLNVGNANDYWSQFKDENEYNTYKDINALKGMSNDQIIDTLKNNGAYTTFGADEKTGNWQKDNTINDLNNISSYINEMGDTDLLKKYKGYLEDTGSYTERNELAHSLLGNTDYFDTTKNKNEEEINKLDTKIKVKEQEDTVNKQFDELSKNNDFEELSKPKESTIASIGGLSYQKDKDYTTEQKNNLISTYLSNKYGVFSDERNNYDDSVSNYTNYVNNQAEVKSEEEFAKEHPVLGTLKARGMQVVNNFIPTAIVDGVQTATGKDIDTNDWLHRGTNIVNGIQDTVSSNMDNGVEQFLYNTLNSTVDSAINVALGNAIGGSVASVGNSLANTAVGATNVGSKVASALSNAKNYVPGITSALMGNGVATNAIIEGKEKGYSDTKAVTMGIIQGAIEGVTEKYSLDRIIKNPNLLKSALVEGSEEVASNWLNDIVDVVANGDKNEYQQYVNEYKTQNPNATNGEALAHAIGSSLADDGLSFLAGGLSGMAMGGTQKGFNSIGTRYAGKQIKNYDTVDNLINTGLELDENSKAYQLAKKLQGKTKVSNYDLGNLRKLIATESPNDTSKDRLQEFGNRLEVLGADKDLSSIANKIVLGETLTESEQKTYDTTPQLQRVVSEYQNYSPNANTNSLNATENEELKKNNVYNTDFTEPQVQNEQYTNAWVKNIKDKSLNRYTTALTSALGRQKAETKHTTTQKIDDVTVNDGKVEYTVNNKTDTAEKLKLDNDMQVISNYASDMSKSEAKQFVDGYTSTQSISPERYSNLWLMAKEGGIAGNTDILQTVNSYGELSEKTVLNAYQQGVLEHQKRVNDAEKDISHTYLQLGYNDIKYHQGKVDTTELSGLTLNDQQKASVKAIKQIVNTLPVDVKFFVSKAEDGKYKGANGYYKDGVIYLDINAGVTDTEKALVDGAIMRTFSHELTHMFEQYAPKEYEDLKNIVFEVLKSQGQDIDQLITLNQRQKINGNYLTYDQAMREVVADGCESMLKNGVDALSDIEIDKNKLQRITEKLIDFIEKIAEKIKNAYKGTKAHSLEAEIIESVDNAVKQIQNKWNKALYKSATNLNAQLTVEDNSTQENSVEENTEDTKQKDTKNKKELDDLVEYSMRKEEDTRERHLEEESRFAIDLLRDVVQGNQSNKLQFNAKGIDNVIKDNLDSYGLKRGTDKISSEIKSIIADELRDYHNVSVTVPGDEDFSYKLMNRIADTIYKKLGKVQIKDKETLKMEYPNIEEWIDFRSYLKGTLMDKGRKGNYIKLSNKQWENLKNSGQLKRFRDSLFGYATVVNEDSLNSGRTFSEICDTLADIDEYMPNAMMINGQRLSEYCSEMLEEPSMLFNLMKEVKEQTNPQIIWNEDGKKIFSQRIAQDIVLDIANKNIQSNNKSIVARQSQLIEQRNKHIKDVMSLRAENRKMRNTIDMMYVDRNLPRRELIAKAMQNASYSSAEYKKLEKYMGMANQIEELENSQKDRYNQIRELKKTNPKSNDIQKLYDEINSTNEDIIKLDRQLTSVRSMGAVRQIIKNETQSVKNKIYEQRKKSNLQKSIKNRATQLLSKMASNAKNKKVPEILKPIVYGFIDGLDLKTSKNGKITKADLSFNNLKRRLNVGEVKLSDDGTVTVQKDGELKEINLHLDDSTIQNLQAIINQIDELKSNYNGTNVLKNMSKKQLTQVRDILADLSKAVTNIDKLFKNGKYTRVSDARNGMIKHLNKMGLKKNLSKGQKAWANLQNKIFAPWVITPINYFKRLGPAGESLFNELMDATDKFSLLSKEIIEYSEKTMKDAGFENRDKTIREWEKDVKEFKDADGNKMFVNVPQLMEIYELSKRPYGRKHLLTGGFEVTQIKDGKFKESHNEKSKHFIDENILNKMCKSLSDGQKQVADKLQNYMATRCGDLANEIYLTLHSIIKFDDKNYYPIDVSEQTTEKQRLSQEKNVWALLNKGWTKEISPDAMNRVVIHNIFDTFAKHTVEVAKYNAYGLAIQDANTIFEKVDSYYNKAMNKLENVSVKEKIEETYGDKFYQYYRQLLQNIDGKIDNNQDIGAINKAISKVKGSKVMYNLRVAMLQPTAYFRAMAVLDNKYLVKALKDISKAKTLIEEMEQTGIGNWKSMGFFDNSTTFGMSELIKGKKTLYNKINDLGMKGAEYGDKFTWGLLYKACQYAVEDKGIKGEDFKKQTDELFREVVYKTQVVDNIMTRSQLMRSNNSIAKIVTVFQSEPIVSLNVVNELANDFMNGKRQGLSNKELLNKHGKKLAVSLFGLGLTNLLSSMIEALWDNLRYSDDDKDFKGEYAENFIQEMEKNINPLNQVPIVSDAWDMFKYITKFSDTYYDNTALWSQSFTDIVNAYDKTFNDKYDNTSLYGKIYYWLKSISTVTGIGVGNLSRDSVALWNNGIEIWNDTIGEATGNIIHWKVGTYNERAKDKATNYLKTALKDRTYSANSYLNEVLKACKETTSKTHKKDNKTVNYTTDEWNKKVNASVRDKILNVAKDKYIEAYQNDDKETMDKIYKILSNNKYIKWDNSKITLDTKIQEWLEE